MKHCKKEKGQQHKPTYQVGSGYRCQRIKYCFHSIKVIGRENAGSFYTLMIPFLRQWLQVVLKISKKLGRNFKYKQRPNVSINCLSGYPVMISYETQQV